MSAATTRKQTLQLYKQFLRHGKNYNNYNFREFVMRRAREEFRDNKSLTDPERIQKCLAKANRDLGVLKRQVAISQLYQSDKLVVE